ncbi:putative TMhelix containing protein I [Vibrio virus VPMCC5]|nr:putative TMhelix containing protein I [Vibrio virus VPMCC5]
MIQSIIAVYRELKSTFDHAMFTFGYLLAALGCGAYNHMSGIIRTFYMRLTGKDFDDEYTEYLFERGDESFDRFLNLVRTIIPDKWRRMLSYETGYW